MQGGRKRRREGGILKDKNPRRSGRTKKFRGHTERSCCRLFFLFSLGWWGGNYIFAQQNTSLRVFIITIIIIIRRKIEVHARAGRQTKQEASASHQASRARITSQQQRQKQQAPLPGLEHGQYEQSHFNLAHLRNLNALQRLLHTSRTKLPQNQAGQRRVRRGRQFLGRVGLRRRPPRLTQRGVLKRRRRRLHTLLPHREESRKACRGGIR